MTLYQLSKKPREYTMRFTYCPNGYECNFIVDMGTRKIYYYLVTPQKLREIYDVRKWRL